MWLQMCARIMHPYVKLMFLSSSYCSAFWIRVYRKRWLHVEWCPCKYLWRTETPFNIITRAYITSCRQAILFPHWFQRWWASMCLFARTSRRNVTHLGIFQQDVSWHWRQIWHNRTRVSDRNLGSPNVTVVHWRRTTTSMHTSNIGTAIVELFTLKTDHDALKLLFGPAYRSGN